MSRSKIRKLPEAEMLSNERTALFGKDGVPKSSFALCFSGGGIRSGTFCLGVLQGLARKGRIKDFHYLSTVSGGGYAGSWLSRWRGEPGFDWEELKSSGGNGGGGQVEPIHPIRRLRSFSNYMSPSWGVSLDTLTVFTIFVRNLIFNLLVWIPLLLAVATVPYVLIGLWGAFAQVPGLESWRPALSLTWIALGVPALLGTGWVMLSLAVLGGFNVTEGTREKISRYAAVALIAAVSWIFVFGVLIYLPRLVLAIVSGNDFAHWLRDIGLHAKQADSANLGAAGIGGGLLAALVGMIGFWSRNGARIRREAQSAFDRLGAQLFNLTGAAAVLAILVAAAIAVNTLFGRIATWRELPAPRSIDWVEAFDHALWLDNGSSPSQLLISLAVLAAFLGIAVVISFFVGANRFSLHAMYGNRLTRAYLGTARSVRNPDPFTDLDPADDVALAQLFPSQKMPDSDRPVLFHVVNMTLNLTRSSPDRRDWQERKAASFTATALHCGSACTGYADTEDYGGKAGTEPDKQGGLTLGRAMTISGAAATPNMGYHSAPFVTMVMTFFNVRLGWWLPHPDAPEDQAREEEPKGRLLHVVKEALGLADDKSWLYLSDGGHFDNLGLYEMVRRRCHRIVVIDGTCDGEFRYSDLHNAIRKAQVDFGVRIDLPPTLPGQPGPGQNQRVVVGRIGYSALNEGLVDGEIYCVKPILNGDEPPALTHYAQTSRRGGQTFPHHSTLDQFFNETQFESYRLLGDVSAEDLCDAMDSYGRGAMPTPVEIEDLEATVAKVQAAYPLSRGEQLVSRTAGTHPDEYSMAIEATPPPPAARGWNGLVAAVEAMSTAKLITSTVVTAGLVSAGLTVGDEAARKLRDALQIAPAKVSIDPVELKLSKEAQDLAADGIKIGLAPEALVKLNDITDRLTVEVTRLSKMTPGAGGETGPNLELEAQIVRLKALIDEFPRPVGGGNGTIFVPDHREALNALTTAVTEAKNMSNDDYKKLLGQIAMLKASIATEIRAASPKQNPSSR
ncbi:patatin-like phospholipase family protein [Sphingopyxis sp. OPL5]|uniref:patatin-like phospholipase family protein n=1 Tax=Sphingopyxis sp. OPL5 TaxID=2486273 RepID=UPI00164D51AB|nr:patatin-like phospholipase family protein [Sphingopyxis sp. OPL5]QNO26067.1 patatin-like phospholipase family protein [Sphingopyxis sp. OPL5]